jgi:hypothetical protein
MSYNLQNDKERKQDDRRDEALAYNVKVIGVGEWFKLH